MYVQYIIHGGKICSLSHERRGFQIATIRGYLRANDKNFRRKLDITKPYGANQFRLYINNRIVEYV